jgi:hypothetical protein
MNNVGISPHDLKPGMIFFVPKEYGGNVELIVSVFHDHQDSSTVVNIFHCKTLVNAFEYHEKTGCKLYVRRYTYCPGSWRGTMLYRGEWEHVRV